MTFIVGFAVAVGVFVAVSVLLAAFGVVQSSLIAFLGSCYIGIFMLWAMLFIIKDKLNKLNATLSEILGLAKQTTEMGRQRGVD